MKAPPRAVGEVRHPRSHHDGARDRGTRLGVTRSNSVPSSLSIMHAMQVRAAGRDVIWRSSEAQVKGKGMTASGGDEEISTL